MDTTKLNAFITDPSLISKDDLVEFEESIAKYPFCSTLHILYLKALSNTNSIHFDEALRSSSIQVNDREQLFNVINLNVDTGVLEDSVKTLEADDTLQSEDVKITIKEVHEQENLVSNEEAINSNAEKHNPILETNILSNAIDSTLIFDVENIDKPEDIITQVKPNENLIDISKANIELEFNNNDEAETENLEHLNQQELNIDFENLSFSEWLNYKKTTHHQTSNTQLASSETVKTIKNREEIVTEPKLTKKEIDHLLDKFIEEEPRLSKPKKDFYNPLNKAKKSLDDDDILVSETLAKIYHLQKKYSKAIKAYEQLSLLNPKKKSFFANQIKKIKKDELK
ncbi:MAG: tetratricopeptide repeat protein [Crocinitomicaceae bacterium]